MIRREGTQFVDAHGRTVLLRGVNLGGSSKVPMEPNGATHLADGFLEHRAVSFVGRPFPLAAADEHFERLRAWGFNFLRFLVTWEAIEHAGPGIYDETYLDYLTAMVEKAGQHGFTLFIDPHQDVWSRFSGGDGAPGWTLEAVGFDIAALHETGAAFLHQFNGASMPRMIWPTNGSKLAAATMFTLFFAGSDFAPLTVVEGEPVQEYLQRHYLDAMTQVARRLRSMPHVLGYDTMNEPLRGYIGWQDLRQWEGQLKLGALPSPFQSMLLGAGLPQEVGVWELDLIRTRQVDTRLLNPNGRSAWRAGHSCVWRENGVWDFAADGSPRLLQPAYFARVNGRPVNFGNEYLRPFAERYAQAMRAAHPQALIFLETEFGHAAPEWRRDEGDYLVYAPHWYDGLTLFSKRYSHFVALDLRKRRPVVLPAQIRKVFAAHLRHLQDEGVARLKGAPTVLGEFGIPFDMHEKAAYVNGDWQNHVTALDRTMRALEDTLMHGTLWNYTADNDNRYGDQWNEEDLSIYSRDQHNGEDGVYAGGRALEAAVRPYPVATAGTPLSLSFDMKTGSFAFTFSADAAAAAPTEIFVPALHYRESCKVTVSDGSFELDQPNERLLYFHSPSRERHTVRIRR